MSSVRDKIRAAADRPEERVPVPEWEVTLRVRGMSAADGMALAKLGTETELYTQHVLSRCVCDETGQPVYPTPEATAELLEKSMPIVQRLLAAVRRVNGLDEDDVKKA